MIKEKRKAPRFADLRAWCVKKNCVNNNNAKTSLNTFRSYRKNLAIAERDYFRGGVF